MRAVVALVAAALGAGLAGPTAVGASSGPTVREYDLGVRQFPQPLGGRFARMPIRLWGAIGVPAGAGPFPVVIVGHGAASTGCPMNENPMADASIWPCWDVVQRNDLGMRHLVRALAAAGFVAVAPDVNAAFTDGWGEPLETLRYGQVLDATTAQLARANTGSASFGVPLRGRVDLSRLGAAGHSRGGWQVLRWAQLREGRTGTADVAAGRGRVSALLLVQATYNEVEPASTRTVPMTVIIGQCDGDIGLQPARNYRRAESDPRRVAPIFKLLLHGANHAFFNTTWTALGRDDGPWAARTRAPCRDARLTAAEQRPWLGPIAVEVFRQGFGIATAPWMQRGAPFPHRLAGLRVEVNRLYPRRAG
jgi:dienelactone hydrolase